MRKALCICIICSRPFLTIFFCLRTSGLLQVIGEVGSVDAWSLEAYIMLQHASWICYIRTPFRILNWNHLQEESDIPFHGEYSRNVLTAVYFLVQNKIIQVNISWVLHWLIFRYLQFFSHNVVGCWLYLIMLLMNIRGPSVRRSFICCVNLVSMTIGTSTL